MEKGTLRILTILLCILMLVGMLPLPTAAEGHRPTPQASEELYALYPNTHLTTSLSQALYEMLSEWVDTVARGECASTVFLLDLDALESLGLQTEWTNSDELDHLDAHEVNAAFWEQFELEALFDLFRHNHPFELYWYDKTESGGVSYGCNFSADNVLTPSFIRVSAAHITFHVAEDYRTDGYDPHAPTLRTERAAEALAAKAAADALVAENAQKDTREMIEAYRDAILNAVSYNTEVADGAHAYGDAWQMIYVFDGDEHTNVVCEGYAKAFQYLCDASGLRTYTVTGTMENEHHMWNVVTMEDGKNYLVDLTNSDEGMVGEHGGTFLAGAAGSAANGYTVAVDGETIHYVYDAATLALHSTDSLTLSAEPYTDAFGVGFASTLEMMIFHYDGKPLKAFSRAQTTSGDSEWLSYQKGAVLYFGDGTVNEETELTYTWYSVGEDGTRDQRLNADPIDAGTYVLAVTRTTDGREFSSPTVTITPLLVHIESIAANDRVYDGTTDVTLQSATLTSSIPLPSHLVLDLTGVSATLDSADAGEHGNVTLTGPLRFATEERNYVLADDRAISLSPSVQILPAPAPTLPPIDLDLLASPFSFDAAEWILDRLPDDIGDIVISVDHAGKWGEIAVTEWSMDANGKINASFKNARGGDRLEFTLSVASQNYEESILVITATVPCPYETHRFTSYASDGNATCQADGTKTARCDGCNVTDTCPDEGSRIAHTYADGTCTACGTADPTPPSTEEETTVGTLADGNAAETEKLPENNGGNSTDKELSGLPASGYLWLLLPVLLLAIGIPTVILLVKKRK